LGIAPSRPGTTRPTSSPRGLDRPGRHHSSAATRSQHEPDEPGLFTASFVDWYACTDTGGELLDPIRAQYRELIVLVSVVYDYTEPMHYCPYIIVDQDTSLARGWALGYPKKIGSIWITRSIGVTSVASPGSRSGKRLRRQNQHHTGRRHDLGRRRNRYMHHRSGCTPTTKQDRHRDVASGTEKLD
jgi:hypothetical protein